NEPSLDLHVLCAPPALTLSQDQTLRRKRRTQSVRPESSQTHRVFPTLQLSRCWLLPSRTAFLPPQVGARNLFGGGTCEFYMRPGRDCKSGCLGRRATRGFADTLPAKRGGTTSEGRPSGHRP